MRPPLITSSRNDLRSSFPHSLGGFEPNPPKNDPVLSHSPDDRAFPSTIPPDPTTSGDRRNSLPDHQATPSSPVTHSQGTQTELSERSPNFFDFPHITRYPIPSTLPFSSFAPSRPHDESTASQSTIPLWGYDRLLRYREFDDQGSSTSSTHSRPTSVFREGTADEMRHDLTICQQHLMAHCASWGDSVSISTHHNEVSILGHDQPRYVS